MARIDPIPRKIEMRTIKKERQVMIEKFWLNLVGGKVRARTIKLWYIIQPYRYVNTCPGELIPYYENIISKSTQYNKILSFGALSDPKLEAERQKHMQEMRELIINEDSAKVGKEELPMLISNYIQYMWNQQEYVGLDENKLYYNYGIVLSKYDAVGLFNMMSNFIPERFMPYVMLFPIDENVDDFKKVLSLIHELGKPTPSEEYKLCSIRVKFTFKTDDIEIANANIQNKYSPFMAPFVMRITVEDQAARCSDYFECYIVLPTEVDNSTNLTDIEIAQKYLDALRIEEDAHINSLFIIANTFRRHHILCQPRELLEDQNGNFTRMKCNIYSNTELSKFVNTREAILQAINSLH